MKKLGYILFITLLCLGLQTGCTSSSNEQDAFGSDPDKLTVVATLFPQYDFAREIAGDKADILLLLPPGMESHSFEPTPGDIITIHNSDIFLYTGDEMEPWVSGIVDNISHEDGELEDDVPHGHSSDEHHPIVADLSEGIELVKEEHNHVHEDEPCEDESHDHEDGYVHDDNEHESHDADSCTEEEHDHDADSCTEDAHEHDADSCTEEEHDHDADSCTEDAHDHDADSVMKEALIIGEHSHDYNPHIWTSPVLAMTMVENIVEAFVAADPDNAAYYESNGAAYLLKLQELDQHFREIVEHADFDTVYVGSKFSLFYFMEEYGLHYVAAYDSCEEEAEPSIKRVVSMIESMKDTGITSVYYQELIEPYIADTIAEAAGGKTYLFHSCHNVSRDDLEAGVTYLSLMEQNAVNLEKGLNR